MTKLTVFNNNQLSRVPEQPLPSIFKSIDGLRGFACLIVLCHHCYFHAGSYAYPVIEIANSKIAISSLLFYGYSGVELFFVLSGFCLTYSMIKNPEKEIDWVQYAINRVRRIYPPFIGVMILLLTLSLIIYSFKINPFMYDNLLSMPSFKHLVLSFSFVSLSFNTSFWTLCVEWRWYLILPIVILIYKQFKILGLLASSVAISLFYAFVIHDSSYTQLQFILSPLPLYLPIFILGVWVAHLVVEKRNNYLIQYSIWGLLASFILLVLVHPPAPSLDFSYARILPFGIFYFFLLITAIYDRRIQSIFSWKPMVVLGQFSYSLYLIHLPIIQGIHSITKSMNWSPQIQFFFYQGFVMPLCILLGYVFYRFLEKPFLKKRLVQPERAI